jgi:hypothetical protein
MIVLNTMMADDNGSVRMDGPLLAHEDAAAGQQDYRGSAATQLSNLHAFFLLCFALLCFVEAFFVLNSVLTSYVPRNCDFAILAANMVIFGDSRTHFQRGI